MEQNLDPKKEAGSQKPQLQNIPPVLNRQVSQALECGAIKYGPWNWRDNNVELMTYLGAMKRHIDAVIDGEDIDPESGAHHLGHVAAGCAIVLDARKHGTLVDNRPPAAKAHGKMLPAKKPVCFGTFRDVSLSVRVSRNCIDCPFFQSCDEAKPMRGLG